MVETTVCNPPVRQYQIDMLFGITTMQDYILKGKPDFYERSITLRTRSK
jgi:hypothetical protein